MIGITNVLFPLIPCKLNCMEHETFDFFEKLGEQHDTNLFIVKYQFDKYDFNDTESKPEYALLQTHKVNNGTGTTCTMDGQFLYQYGERCNIIAFMSISIVDLEETDQK